MPPIISIRGLGKKYFIGENKGGASYKTARDKLTELLKIPFRLIAGGNGKCGGVSAPTTEFWALKDISLDIEQGEVMGIIGRNGAGKSTLLKILSQITEPTEGEIRIRGRVASLLEVGTGFHPELTGRENIFLNGAILGMTRTEIRRKFDEIVAFAEIEKFLDTPVKRYSSGMYVRLAFAVAAHLEPDILVVDEVLAVGDAEFQRKCLGKMNSVAHGGRTVLFVSHNMQAIRMLCGRVMLLDSGHCAADGAADDTIGQYRASGASEQEGEWCAVNSVDQFGDETVILRAMRSQDERGAVSSVFESHMPIIIEMEIDVVVPENNLQVGFDLMNDEGAVILRSWQNDGSDMPYIGANINVLRAAIPGRVLNAGRFHIAPRIAIFCSRWIVDYHVPPLLTFDVILTHGETEYMNHPDRSKNGMIAPILRWTSRT